MKANRLQRLLAEALGTAILLATVVGSGIMGDAMGGGNDGIALLGNTIATGAILVVLITIFGPISGAHFNPAVTLVFLLKREISVGEAIQFVVVQVIGGILGVFLAHGMFDLALISEFSRPRTGMSQWLAEAVATFGLLITILGCVRFKPDVVPYGVGLYITAGYWFTASTSFANPAVTVARSFTETFAGINPVDAPGFIIAQFIGAVIALGVAMVLFREG